MYNPIQLPTSRKSAASVASLTSVAHNDIGMSSHERSIIQKALRILYKYQKNVGVIIDDKNLAIDFLRLRFEFCEREIFSAFFLNCRHQLIAFEELFYGTISHSSVFP